MLSYSLGSAGAEAPAYSDPATLAFVLIPIVLALLFAAGVWFAWKRTGAVADAPRAATLALLGAAAWMAITWTIAENGAFRRWDAMPPPFALLVLSILLLGLRIGLGQVGRRLAHGIPLWVLVAVQAFRLPLEMAMHAMYERGVMPVQMSYSGFNYDIVTGASAIVVAALAARGGTQLVRLWNIVGLGLLINVVVVAILATPAFRYFGDQHLNTWVTYPPFVWLPAVMVLAALVGHIIIFRALAHRTTA